MKRKILVGFLSAMMVLTSVPTVAMAATGDSATEETVTDEGADILTEEDASASEESLFASDGETTDLEEETESQEAGDLLESADAVTLNGVEFDTGKTYLVPITLKNAGNLEQDSAAVACPGKFATLKFENGKPIASTNLRSVTVGTLTDYAYDFKIYQEAKNIGSTADATVVATQTVAKADGSGNHDVPETISFEIPEACYGQNGVYLSMYVDAMGYAPDAYLQFDYAEAKESGDSSLNFTTEIASSKVEQFGEYNITSKVTVTDGRITDVELEGNGYGGSHAEDNEMYVNKAINGTSSTKGMKSKLIGLYMNDAQKLNDLDTVSGATYSSNAIKEATMNALGVTIEKEVIPDAPEEKPAAGYYSITIKDRTDVVDHGLVGEEKKTTAYLRVDDSGKMWLSYKMVSGSAKEPLYVLGYNGYYPNGDTSQELSMEGVTYATEKMTASTIGEQTVVTDITVPLDSVSQTYVNNVYLYVDAMKNLDGETSGVLFDHGKFNINSTITLYWDTLTNLSEENEASNALASLSDGVYKIQGSMVKPNMVEESMSNKAINHNIKLVIKNGLPYISMNFNGMNVGNLKGYLKNLSYYASGYEMSGNSISGTTIPVTVDSLQTFSNGKTMSDAYGSEYPNDITFPLNAEAFSGGEYATYVPMQVFVPIMDAISAGTGTQNVLLKLDYTTIVKTSADDKDFAETETQQNDPADVKSQNITVSVKNKSGVVTKQYGDSAFSLGAKAKTALSYKSSDSKIISVDKNGKVTIHKTGTASITITAKASSSYKTASKKITVKVTKGSPVIKTKLSSKSLKYRSLKSKAASFALGATTSSKGKLSYKKASGTSAITINSKGTITVKKGLKKGSYKVKILVKSAAKGYYNAGSKKVTITVKVK